MLRSRQNNNYAVKGMENKMQNPLNMIFMGTPDLAATVLGSLLDNGYPVTAVVTQPDKPKGRGKALACSPVKELAVEKGIPVLQPERAKDEAFIEELRTYAPDIIIVAAYGKILPKAILDMPKYGCINVHTSLLPDYKGAAPIQWAILNGESETGVTIMYMDEGCDTGDIISAQRITITSDETGGGLHDKLAVLGGELLVRTLPSILDGSCTRTPQEKGVGRYVSIIDKSLGNLDFTRPAVELERYIRGLDPWPCAFTKLEGKMLKLWKAYVIADATEAAPGTVLPGDKKALRIATGEGILAVTELQPEGKRRMKTEEYLNGYTVAAGTVLGE